MAIKSALLLITCLVPLQAFGWGAGHDFVSELAVEMLHDVLPAECGANIIKWAHAPDDMTAWEKLKSFQVPDADLRLLHAHKLNNAYSSHFATGQAVEFILLVNAFKENDSRRIAFWSACLLHTLADEAACNHDPLIHYATYGLKEGYHLKLGKGVGLDFADVARTPSGKELVHRLASSMPAHPLSASPKEALLQIMMSALESNAYMTRRGTAIAGSFALNAGSTQLDAASMALAELGVHGATHGRDVITAAKEFARRGLVPELTPEILAEFEDRKVAYIAARPLSDDSMYAELLKSQAPIDKPAVGLLVEPSVSMNQARLSFGAKFVTTAIARSTQRMGVPIRLVDLRSLQNKSSLSPQNTPVLVVCSGQFNVDTAARDALAAYAAAGGRFLWIGGEHRGMLGKLSENLEPADAAMLPVTFQYGKDSPISQTARFHFAGAFKDALGSEPFRFEHNPNTHDGWQPPRCRYVFKSTEGLAVLAEMRLLEKSVAVAAACMSSDGSAKAIFIPEYLIAPYVLSDEDSVVDLSLPTLDKVGSKLLAASLKLIGQLHVAK